MPRSRRNQRNKVRKDERALIPTMPIGPGVVQDALPNEVESRPIRITLVAPHDLIHKYEKVGDDLYCRRQLVYETFLKCEAAQRVVNAISENIASREVFIKLKEDTPEARGARARVEQAMRFAGGKRIGGWRNFVKELIRHVFGSVTGAFIPYTASLVGSGNPTSFKLLTPLSPFPFWNSEVMAARYDAEWPENHINDATGIWYTEGTRSNWHSYELQQNQYVQAVDSSIGFGAFQSGIPLAEWSLASMATHMALMDMLRHAANATDPAQIVVLNNIDTDKFQAILKSREEAIAARDRGEDIQDSQLRKRILVTNLSRDVKAGVETANLRVFPEGMSVLELLATTEKRIALNFGVRDWRVSGDSGNSERFGNATNVALLNADEPGMRLAEAIVMEVIDFIIGTDDDLIDAAFIGVDNARETMQIKYELDVAQSAVAIRNAVSSEAAAQYINSKRIMSDPVVALPDPALLTAPAMLPPPQAQAFIGRSVRSMPLLVAVKRAEGEMDVEDYLQCAKEAQARWARWIERELPGVVDNLGLDRSELSQEVSDIAAEIKNYIVRCAQRYAGNERGTRLRLFYDQLANRWMTLIAPPRDRGPDTTFPKRNMFATMTGLGPQIAARARNDDPALAAEARAISVADVSGIATNYMSDLERYFRAASAAGYWRDFPPDYAGPVMWDLNEVALHCHDCPAIVKAAPNGDGIFPNMRACLRASGNRYPRSLDLACRGNCLCSLRVPPRGV